MRNGKLTTLALAAALVAAVPALAQKMPDIGFKSVGRGAPLAASVLDYKEEVGPNWIRAQGAQAGPDPKAPFPLNGYLPNALPKNYKPLPRDIYTSRTSTPTNIVGWTHAISAATARRPRSTYAACCSVRKSTRRTKMPTRRGATARSACRARRS